MFWQRMRRRSILHLGLLPLVLVLSAGTVRSATKVVTTGPGAEIVLHVPPDAAVWLDGIRSQYAGVERRFVTPPLTAGERYFYNVRAVWTQGGQLVERRRQLSFRSGDVVVLDFGAESGVEPVVSAGVQTSYYYSPPVTTAVAVAPVRSSYYYAPVPPTTYTPVAPVTPIYYTYPQYVRPLYLRPTYIPAYSGVRVYP